MREKLVDKLNYTFVLEAIQDRYTICKNGETIVIINTTHSVLETWVSKKKSDSYVH